ncbi:MAG: MBL fold metallo-hydrolase [Candidatus Micrarchaeota archaeon]
MRVTCRGLQIGLDSPDGDLPFLSHAHSDHTSGLKRLKKMLATPETLELADIPAETVDMPGTRMLEAGHILGARQLLIECDGGSVLYTGDICVKPNIFGMKAEAAQCDRLIMEATYGDPAYSLPSPEEVHTDIQRWVEGNDSSNIIIGSYELGKAQEIIKTLNELGIAPVVTDKAERFTYIYEKYGIKLDRVVVGTDEAEEMMSRRFVAIVPMGKAKRYFARRLEEAFERPTLCAAVTGWALHYRFNTDAAFPLSDHADFKDLVWFAEQTGAKKIEFFCGDGSAVLSALKTGPMTCKSA